MPDSEDTYTVDWITEGMPEWQYYGGSQYKAWSLSHALIQIRGSQRIDKEQKEHCSYRLTNTRTGAMIVV